jgi:hypothetical protein
MRAVSVMIRSVVELLADAVSDCHLANPTSTHGPGKWNLPILHRTPDFARRSGRTSLFVSSIPGCTLVSEDARRRRFEVRTAALSGTLTILSSLDESAIL